MNKPQQVLLNYIWTGEALPTSSDEKNIIIFILCESTNTDENIHISQPYNTLFSNVTRTEHLIIILYK